MIILARHGQTEWNKIKRVQGWQNSPLTELGETQAQRVSDRIFSIVENKEVVFYSSPLGRAHDTAKVIASALASDVDVILDPLLKEYSYGNWEGQSLVEVKEHKSDEWARRSADKWNYVVPGGESYAIVSDRAATWLHSLPKGKIIIAVSHQMIGRAIRGSYLALDNESTMALTQENDEIVILENGIERTIVA